MKNTWKLLAVLNFAFVCLGGDNKLENAQVSFDLPEGWMFQEKSDVQNSLDDYQSNPSRESRVDSEVVLFIITKYREPTDRLNPTIYVNRHQLEEAMNNDPVSILQTMFIDPALSNSVLIAGPLATVFGERKAAKASFKRAWVSNDGKEYVFLVRCWVILRQHDFIYVQMSGAESGPDRCDGEFEEFLHSLAL